MTTKMISEETLQPQAQEETRITPRDLRRVFWRSFQMEFSWNYERQMNLAFVYALIPVLKKLYPRREELAAALKRHLVFFNTTPHIVTLLLGITFTLPDWLGTLLILASVVLIAIDSRRRVRAA